LISAISPKLENKALICDTGAIGSKPVATIVVGGAMPIDVAAS
jgi:hypothetical protein